MKSTFEKGKKPVELKPIETHQQWQNNFFKKPVTEKKCSVPLKKEEEKPCLRLFHGKSATGSS